MATVRGTCEEMCPARERAARAASGEVHALERGDALMVKKYRRTVMAGSDDAASVRTISALERAVERVLAAHARVAREESACGTSSATAFADDRLRSVRQDLSMQGLFADDPDACARAGTLLERMVSYSVASERERRAGCESRERRDFGESRLDFGESRLRDEQLGKTFGMLFSVYRELGADRIDPRRVGRAFSLFVCSATRDGTSSSELAGDFRRVGREALSTAEARFGLRCLHALLERNHERVFKLVESKECSYELACVLERHFPVLRVEALRSMNAAMNATPMSLDELARVLRFDDARDAETYAKVCGLSVDDDARTVSFRTLPFTYPNVRHPDVAEKLCAPSSLVDAKRITPTDERSTRDVCVGVASLTLKSFE